MANRREQTFILGGSKITVDGDCSHKIKRRLLLGRRAMTNLDSMLKSRDVTLPTSVWIVKTMIFPISRPFTTHGHSVGTSVSILPMNIQPWFPLGLTSLISLQSKGLLSRVFSSTTVQKHQFFDAQPSLWSNLTSIHDYWKNHSFDYMDLCWQSDVSAF